MKHIENLIKENLSKEDKKYKSRKYVFAYILQRCSLYLTTKDIDKQATALIDIAIVSFKYLLLKKKIPVVQRMYNCDIYSIIQDITLIKRDEDGSFETIIEACFDMVEKKGYNFKTLIYHIYDKENI